MPKDSNKAFEVKPSHKKERGKGERGKGKPRRKTKEYEEQSFMAKSGFPMTRRGEKQRISFAHNIFFCQGAASEK